ncbi:hypothetical protein NSA27_06090 [Clostridium tepidum]|nr:hypothetical protein [Clostridium tepidum]MCR1934263.1 hypothetical protein [Clostridium tepidum]
MLAMKKSSYSSVGIDGCKGKWIAVCITEDTENGGIDSKKIRDIIDGLF